MYATDKEKGRNFCYYVDTKEHYKQLVDSITYFAALNEKENIARIQEMVALLRIICLPSISLTAKDSQPWNVDSEV